MAVYSRSMFLRASPRSAHSMSTPPLRVFSLSQALASMPHRPTPAVSSMRRGRSSNQPVSLFRLQLSLAPSLLGSIKQALHNFRSIEATSPSRISYLSSTCMHHGFQYRLSRRLLLAAPLLLFQALVFLHQFLTSAGFPPWAPQYFLLPWFLHPAQLLFVRRRSGPAPLSQQFLSS